METFMFLIINYLFYHFDFHFPSLIWYIRFMLFLHEYFLLIYFKSIRYVKGMNQRTAIPSSFLSLAQTDLEVVGRTIVLVSILIVFGIPYLISMLISFFYGSSIKIWLSFGFYFSCCLSTASSTHDIETCRPA